MRGHTCYEQTDDQRCRFAVFLREALAEPLSPRAAAKAARHVGGGPRLTSEHEELRIKVELAVEPTLPLPQDV